MESHENIRVEAESTPGETTNPSAFVFRGLHCWLVLLAGFCIFFLWRKFAATNFRQWLENRASRAEALHRDDEAWQSRERAVQASRLRLQDQMDAAAERHKIKLKEREEAKRQERIKVYENLQKAKSKSATQEQPGGSGQSKQKPKGERLRGDFYPLINSEATCFRPSRRGGGSAGG